MYMLREVICVACVKLIENSNMWRWLQIVTAIHIWAKSIKCYGDLSADQFYDATCKLYSSKQLLICCCANSFEQQCNHMFFNKCKCAYSFELSPAFTMRHVNYVSYMCSNGLVWMKRTMPQTMMYVPVQVSYLEQCSNYIMDRLVGSPTTGVHM